MKIVRISTLIVVIVTLIGGGFYAYKRFGSKTGEHYFVDVINSSKAPADVTVSGAEGSFSVAAGDARTFRVEKQEAAARDTPREFAIKTEGKVSTFKSVVPYDNHIVVDVTGTTCVVAADYGLQYRPKGVKLPEGTRTIKILKTYEKHPPVFVPGTPERPGAQAAFKVDVGVSETLPEKLKLPGGAVRPVVRLVVVPGDVVKNAAALYEMLGKT